MGSPGAAPPYLFFLSFLSFLNFFSDPEDEDDEEEEEESLRRRPWPMMMIVEMRGAAITRCLAM